MNDEPERPWENLHWAGYPGHDEHDYVERPDAELTDEQRWIGQWFDCACGAVQILPSERIEAWFEDRSALRDLGEHIAATGKGLPG